MYDPDNDALIGESRALRKVAEELVAESNRLIEVARKLKEQLSQWELTLKSDT